MAIKAPPGRVTAADKQAALKRWRADPCLFSKQVLGLVPYEGVTGDGQAGILRALTESTRVSVRSGQKTGKSEAAAAAALWWLMTRPQSRVILTAASGHQVQQILWRAVRGLVHQAAKNGTPICDPDAVSVQAHSGLRLPDLREIVGLSTDKPEQFAGLSAPELLIIVDEASGVREEIFDAILGNLTGGGSLLLLSNPTKTSGFYYDTFHTKRGGWRTIHLSSLDTPNCTGGKRIPGLAEPSTIAWSKEQYGENSPYWDVRVLGNFPRTSDRNVIAMSLVESAIGRTPPESDEPLVLGVDVARYGQDSTVIAARRGLRVHPLVIRRGLDGPGAASEVALTIREYGTPGEFVRVRIDSIGVGAAAYDCISKLPRVEAESVNVGERAERQDDFVNLRSELWFRVKEWLVSGGCLPQDERLAAELVAAEYSADAHNRLLVEGKEVMRKKLHRSPDRADALALCLDSVDGPGDGTFPSTGLDMVRKLIRGAKRRR